MNKTSSAFFVTCILCLVGLTASPAQWLQQNSGTTAKLTDVVMLDSMTAIVVGYSGTILKTTNAGASWIPKMAGGTDWNALSFANATQGVAVGNNGGFGMTTNGGETWTTSTLAGRNLLSVAYVNSAAIFFGTDSGEVFRTTNAGITWTTVLNQLLGTNDLFFAMNLVPRYTLYALPFYQFGGSVYRSTDGGGSWTQQLLRMGINARAVRGDFVRRGSTAFIVGNNGQFTYPPIILRLTPQDTAWTTVYYPITQFVNLTLRDISVPSEQIGYACGDWGMIVKTVNGGGTWDTVRTGTSRFLNAIHFFNTQRGFAVGDSGMILFTLNGATSVRENEDAPSEVKLLQNYPNPFNTTTKITFVLPLFSQDPAQLREGLLVSLKIYDVLGNDVATLVDERLTPGIYERTFDATGFASGVYIYRLTTPLGSLSRKLLLLK
jgi:photosystem II stability/assembly factor-like uncharacterized protein